MRTVGLCLLSLAFCPNALATTNIIKTLYDPNFSSQRTDTVADEFVLEGEFGFVTATGNTNTSSVKGALDAEHETPSWSNQYRVELLYKESEVQVDGQSQRDVTAQHFYTTAQMDYKLDDPDNRLFLFGEYDNNRFSAYKYQAALAAGWAHKAYDENDYQFRYSIGPGYGFAVNQDGDRDHDKHGFIVRASVEYKYQMSTGAKFRQFLSAEANDSSTRSRSETSISANVMDSLAMKLSFIMNYNSSADNLDVKNLDTETSVALVYQFF